MDVAGGSVGTNGVYSSSGRIGWGFHSSRDVQSLISLKFGRLSICKAVWIVSYDQQLFSHGSRTFSIKAPIGSLGFFCTANWRSCPKTLSRLWCLVQKKEVSFVSSVNAQIVLDPNRRYASISFTGSTSSVGCESNKPIFQKNKWTNCSNKFWSTAANLLRRH